jgi:hypothetical protein
MATYLVFGRTEYAEPLALVSTVEASAPPAVDDISGEWLELVAAPANAVIWVLRNGRYARDTRGAPG